VRASGRITHENSRDAKRLASRGPVVSHNDVGLATARVDCAVCTLTALGSKEAEMRIIGCDLHTCGVHKSDFA
jgi:hypothetical protein